jgi:hypothetical protein
LKLNYFGLQFKRAQHFCRKTHVFPNGCTNTFWPAAETSFDQGKDGENIQGQTQRGRLQRDSPPPKKIYNLKKKADFADTMVSNVSRDLPFSQNQPLQSADEQYTGSLKNKIKTL